MGRHGHSAHKTALLKESWEDHKVSAVPGVHGRQPLAGHDFLRIDGIIPTRIAPTQGSSTFWNHSNSLALKRRPE
jgi:hypothetical protein